MTENIYVVPLVDVNWENFAPMNPKRNFVHDPPPVDLCLEDVHGCNSLMLRTVGGKFVYSPHTGTYARDEFFTEPFLRVYREAAAAGAEMTIHPHEQISRVGVRYHEVDHMTEVITSRVNILRTGGVQPIGYRGGHFAYLNYFTPLLESLGLTIDLSGRPGFLLPVDLADWTGAPFSAYYLSRSDYRKSASPGDASGIFEIPIGADGIGTEDSNTLYAERYDCQPIWDSIVARAEREAQPQFVYMLFHTMSMHRPAAIERFERFVDYVGHHHGVVVTATECRDKWHALGLG